MRYGPCDGEATLFRALALLLLLLAPREGVAQIATDGTVGAAVDLPGLDVEIPADLGTREGGNLFHSFETFNIDTGGSATFTPDGLPVGAAIENVISRVTGGTPSNIDGALRSTIGEAHFFFLNPAGVMIGENGSIDVGGAFHLTTADQLIFTDAFGNEVVYSATDPASSVLTSARPEAYGFLGAPAPIEVRGFVETRRGGDISLVGGDLSIVGPGVGAGSKQGIVSAQDGDVRLVSVASGGVVRGIQEPVDGLALEGFSELGNISITDDAIVSSAAISPVIKPTAGGAIPPPGQLTGPFVDADGNVSQFAAFPIALDDDQVQPGDVFLVEDDLGFRFYLRPNDRPGDGAGDVAIRGHHLRIVDSDVRAFTAGDADGGTIDVALTGDFTARKEQRAINVGLLATSGFEIAGTQSFFTFDGQLRTVDATLTIAGAGAGGDVTLDAANVSLEGGALLSATSSGAGQGGDVVVTAGTVAISGADSTGESSAIFSNAQGAGDAGEIRVGADVVELTDGGAIIAQTAGNGNAGDITVRTGILRVLGTSQIDNSTSAQSLPPGSTETTTGNAGNIDVVATEEILLSGRADERNFARLSSFSQERSQGRAGSITASAPLVTIENGGGIAVTTRGAGPGGDIRVDAGILRIEDGGEISARSTAEATDLPAGTPFGDAGRIELNVDKLEIDAGRITAEAEQSFGGSIGVNGVGVRERPDGSLEAILRDDQEAGTWVRIKDGEISTSVGDGSGDGGNILLNTKYVILKDSVVKANAVGGDGGNILVQTEQVFSDNGGFEASSQFGSPGTIEIASPTTNITAGITPLEVPFQDASRLMRPSCATRTARESRGSFNVARRRGLATSPEGLLLAFEDVEVGADVMADTAIGATRDVAAGPAEPASRTIEIASNLNLRGADAFRGGAFEEAADAFEKAARLASDSGEPEREAQALSNAARAALDGGQPERARALLAEATRRTGALVASPAKVHLEIHLARSHQRLGNADPARRAESLLAAHAALLRALELATQLGEPRGRSFALGNLGTLYRGEGRLEEALFATRRALGAAQQADAADALYRWHWQEGRLLWSQGRSAEAIAAYRRAVAVLEETRQESLTRYGASEVFFRRLVAPVYLELVSALLQTSARVSGEARVEALLVEARATTELLKAAELRDYFRDDCAVETVALQDVPGAAIVYPIGLPDRLELLVNLPSGLSRYTVPVPADELDAAVSRFRAGLQEPGSTAYAEPARRLHDWLVAPYAEALAAEDVGTLVFVPGGSLRTVPMSALHDGERFLVERYAVAVTPGLSLVDPTPLDPSRARLLLAGVSEGVQGFEPLPMVPAELEAVRELYGGEVLLDEGFRADLLEGRVEQGSPSVVHLASHAIFTGDPETSFLLTHDDRLTLDRMAELVAPTRFRDDPLELLVLSACETAAGDERAALGLAGVAIRAGARSAVGSLWTISDDAAFELIVDFYSALREPSRSKAGAMQQAQIQLMQNPRFGHPFFWSPYLVISNWL